MFDKINTWLGTLWASPSNIKVTKEDVDLIDDAFGELAQFKFVEDANVWINKDTPETNALRRYMKVHHMGGRLFDACTTFYSIRYSIVWEEHLVLDKIKLMTYKADAEKQDDLQG